MKGWEEDFASLYILLSLPSVGRLVESERDRERGRTREISP